METNHTLVLDAIHHVALSGLVVDCGDQTQGVAGVALGFHISAFQAAPAVAPPNSTIAGLHYSLNLEL